jgi:predicted site-specific integrase-resolvase
VTSDGVPQLLTLLSVAKILCVSPHTVRSWVRKGKLQPVRLCRRLLFTTGEVARFVSEAESRPRQNTGVCGFEQNKHAL